jgi:tryptophanyl-tRNA synthetase
MKKRVLSGIQPSGKLHIGNYFGMIKRMVEYQRSSDLFCFIANLHSLTTLQDKEQMKNLTLQAAMDLLALGIDPEKSTFWVQSDVPEVAELTWILSCITPMGLMERAHSYKDKIAKGIQPNLGLFCYPSLMTADILINQSELVPVGKDQKQHLEIARDIAIKFNNHYGKVFTIPEPDILKDVAVIPGTDGQKMSKSYGNTIPIFDDEKTIKKTVMGIVTDSKGVEEPKDPKTCNVFALYKLFADNAELKEMEKAYKKGGLGYGDAKKKLLEKINKTFAPFQEKRRELEANPKKVEEILASGAEKVRKVSNKTLEKVRKATGLKY